MSSAGRLGDIASGHGCFPPTPITSGSSDVSINGLPAARKGDSVLLHACPCPYMPHGIHGRSISAGSPTVSINGKPAARVGDAINCGGSVAAGSPNVYIGSKSYRSPVHECVKNAVTNNEPFLSITPLVDALPTTWYLNNYTYPATTAAKAVETSTTESSDEEGFGVMDGIHAALDAGGLAPGVGIIPDALNALIYAIEGDKVNAAISAAAMIPVVGQSATAAKYAAKAAEATTGVVKAISKSEKELLEGISKKVVNPKSFDEVDAILEARKAELLENSYQGGKYTDEELLLMAKHGSHPEQRFLVSFQPVAPDKFMDNALTYVREDTKRAPMWVTSFDQLEHADKDPELIAKVLGTNYDSNKQYVMHILDTKHLPTAKDTKAFVPTWENMKKNVASDLAMDEKFSKEVLENVMSPEAQNVYQEQMGKFWNSGLNEFEQDDVKYFANQYISNPMEREEFKARHYYRTQIGANSDFAGNGLTKNNAGIQQYGVLEQLILDRNPKTVRQLLDMDTPPIKVIKL